MLHDDSTDRRAGPFEIDARARDYCQAIRDAGFDLHLTVWAQPHAEYLERACAMIVDLGKDYGASSVCWDAEEPWTQAVGELSHAAAADAIDLFGMREGVTGIGYASDKLDPLLARAAYVVPQCYATTRVGSLSIAGIANVIERWRKHAPHAELQPGLAVYAQNTMGLLDDWRACGKPSTVWLWSLRWIARGSGSRMVSELRDAIASAG